ncbi:CARDB domain-containing protein, partial [Chloroflexota bacterium]
NYTLTIGASPSSSGTTSPAVGIYNYSEGQVVSISATAATGWRFTSWTGDVNNPNANSTTVTMNTNKTVTANFSQIPTGDTTPPVCSSIVAANITKTKAEISWTTNEPADSQVEYWASPSQFTLLDSTQVTEHIVSLTGLSPATTFHFKVMSRDTSGNLTVSTERTFVTAGIVLGPQAEFSTSWWNIALKDAGLGKEVTISHVVINTSDQPGTYDVTLSINGVERDTKEVSLNAGESQNVSFTVNIEEAGEYTATIGDTTLLFSVGKVATTGSWLQTWLLIGLLVIVIPATALVTVAIMRRRQKFVPVS